MLTFVVGTLLFGKLILASIISTIAICIVVKLINKHNKKKGS